MVERKKFKCRNCESDKYVLVYKNLPDYFYGFNGSFTYVNCGDCGLFQLLEIPLNLNKHYSAYRLHSKDSIVYHFFRKLFIKHCYYFAEGCGRKLLDVGCGNGWYLKEMKVKKWECCGYEYNKNYAKELSNKLKINILFGDSLNNYDNDFDLITMNFSIEHLVDPRGTLEMLSCALKKGGKIIISLPSIESKEADIFQSRWFHLDPPRHITLFSKTILADLLLSLGFSDIMIKDLPIPTGFAGSISYLFFAKFILWIWYLSILPGYLFSQIVGDGNYMVSAVKK